MALLKSEGRKSQEIASFLGFWQQAVNFWLHRYKREDIGGLPVKTGRGRARPLILSPQAETSKASSKLSNGIGKEFPRQKPSWNLRQRVFATLERFVKNLTADINASDEA